MLKKDEEYDWVDKGATLLDQKLTTMKAFPLGRFGGPLISEGRCDVSPPKVPSFGMLGKTSTSSETSVSKRVGKVPLGNRPDSQESGILTGVALVGLRVGQLKMGRPLVFTARR